jgi:hypothetical protein
MIFPLYHNHYHNQNQYPYQYQLGHQRKPRTAGLCGRKDVRKMHLSLGVPLKLMPPLHTHSQPTSTARAGLRTGSGEGSFPYFLPMKGIGMDLQTKLARADAARTECLEAYGYRCNICHKRFERSRLVTIPENGACFCMGCWLTGEYKKYR